MRVSKQNDWCRYFLNGTIASALIVMTCFGTGFSQEASGGYGSIMNVGVGARALSLGGAYIAAPEDASAVYWNPGALDFLTRKSFSMFYSNLPLGSQYSFVGYVHPTVSVGTFGFAIRRFATDGIEETDKNTVLGTFSFSHTQFLLSYGKLMPYNLAIGGNLKVEQQDFPLTTGAASGTGVGVDLGLIYRPEWLPTFLQNLSIGVIIQNALPVIMKPGQVSVRSPRTYKLGFAKAMRSESGANAISLFADMQKVEYLPMSTLQIHVGAEYAYNGGAMLRVGYNDGVPTFGVGAAVSSLHLDYSYGKFAPNLDFSENHRISLSYAFGHTKNETIDLAKRKRDEAIAFEVAKKQRLFKELEIKNNLDAGKSFYTKGEYFSAFSKFNTARDLDPDNDEANQWWRRAKEKLDEEEKLRQQKEAASALETQRKLFVDGQLNKGIKLFEAKNYDQAIIEWRRGLEQDPENSQIKRWIDNTKRQIDTETAELITQADRLAAAGNYNDAIEKLREVQNLGTEDQQIKDAIATKVERLRNRMGFEGAYRSGLVAYQNKNYDEAMRLFDLALKSDPTNNTVKEYRQKAYARAHATDEDWLNNDVRRKYIQAATSYSEEKYAEALKVLYEIQKVQPFKRQILQLIDDAEERLGNK